MQDHPDPLGVLSSTHAVVEQARHVTIHPEAVARLAQRLYQERPEPPVWDRELHFFDGGGRTVNYLLLLDALNFCFWGDPETVWKIAFHGRVLSGYGALAGALTRAIEEGVPVWDAAFLAELDEATLAAILRGWGEVPLFAERLAIARETGLSLLNGYHGWFSNAVEQAGGSAIALVRRVLEHFPSFRDEVPYRGQTVRLYKRAQILCADLYGSFLGQSYGHFADMDQVTVFADYKLPQVLRELGVLEYGPDLAERVDQLELLPPGSAWEVEIRAATVWACELVRRALAARGEIVPAYRLDWYLWDLSQTLSMQHPHHRTRTIFY
ncbi:MAG: hypothetical protein HY689_01650 [Chloroflexi bacterium]|nr:hypothetical protein [Chloroflexota bacterium]